MSQYKTLDDLIVARLSPVNALCLDELMRGDRRDECNRLATMTGRESFRIMDARLQALKKRHLIEFVRQPHNRGWVVKA